MVSGVSDGLLRLYWFLTSLYMSPLSLNTSLGVSTELSECNQSQVSPLVSRGYPSLSNLH